MSDEEKVKDALLLGTLPHIAFDGWGRKAMEAGARDAGYARTRLDLVFPGGARDVAGHFCGWGDRRMLDALDRVEMPGLKIRERIATAVRTRIEVVTPHREAVRVLLSFMALPSNVPLATACLYRSVDAMWRAVGDRSTDFNFYTKRALLSGVYSATVLYWLADDSEDFAASWGFLDRRIANVMTLQSLRGRGEKFVCGLPNPFRLFRGARAEPRTSAQDG
ncbi:MAG: COQ9 family protein [Alphaproteobacteria bacterium]